MKSFTYLFLVLFTGAGFAQDTLQTNNNDRERNRQVQEPSWYEVRDTMEYTSNKQIYIFSRDENGDLNIMRAGTTGEEEDFGRLRRTTTDGFYLLTTTEDEEASFGRFDDEGNLRTYRYDRATDTLVEQEFIATDPVRRQNNRSQNMRQQNMRRTQQGNTNRGRGNTRSNNGNNPI